MEMAKNKKMAWHPALSQEEIEFTSPDVMAKLLGTIDPAGYPHVTLIACNKAVDQETIKWGQFSVGTSKKNVLRDPRQGVFYMTSKSPYRFLQAKMDFDRISTDGADAMDFNQASLFRYNTYVRIYKVYFNTVKAVSGIRDLSMGGIVKGMLSAPIAAGGVNTKSAESRMPAFGTRLFNGPINPKFACYFDPSDGYPIIVPCFQARAFGGNAIVFPLSQFRTDLESLKEGDKIAFYAMTQDLRSLLVKGTFSGFKKVRGITTGRASIDIIYNSMPPAPGQVYPVLETRPKVEQFA
jgi:hypothetical protein